MTVVSRDNLKTHYDKRLTLLEFLDSAATMMDESKLKEQDCAQTFSLLVVTMGGTRR